MFSVSVLGGKDKRGGDKSHRTICVYVGVRVEESVVLKRQIKSNF